MKDDRVYLGHILDAILDIEQYAGVGRDAFMTDKMRQDALLRKLEVIVPASAPHLRTFSARSTAEFSPPVAAP